MSENSTVKFAGKLHPKLGKPEENLFYSPFSLLTALGMTAAGAKGRTQAVLTELLESPANPTSAQKYFGSLVAEVQGDGSDRDYELTTVNALWSQKGFALNPVFTKSVSNDYGGGVTEVDYVGDKKVALETINGWANENTKGKIPTILSEDDVDELTRLVLTNAIYFKGNWTKAFKEEETYDRRFFTANGEKKVPQMSQSGTFKCCFNDQFSALELDYRGGDLSMLLVLPAGPDRWFQGYKDTTVLDSQLDAVYDRAVAELQERDEVDVTIPKFKVETEYRLKPTLSELGAGIIFSDEADFSGITKEARLKVTQVVHKAFVEVNEAGTEAAAVTAVVAGLESCRGTPKFEANRPFVFFIRNKNSGNVLFAGRVADPDPASSKVTEHSTNLE